MERVRDALRRELGHDEPVDLHSWRCGDKERYPGPCGCADAVADLVAEALAHTLAIAEAAREYVAASRATRERDVRPGETVWDWDNRLIAARARLGVASTALTAAVDAEQADLERARELPTVGASDLERRVYVGHGFTPGTGPFADPDRCRVSLSRYPCPDGHDAHDPSLPPEDVDAFGRIVKRLDLERGEGGS